MGVSLTFNKRDKDKIFRRPHWDDDLGFTWIDRLGAYAYCTVFEDGKIELHKAGNSDFVRVGGYVLGKEDIVEYRPMKEIDMGKNVNYIGGEYQVVKVTYDIDDKEAYGSYNFKIDIGISVGIGDLVVVEASNGYGLCRVVEIIEKALDAKTMTEYNKATAWVVNVVDETAHNYRKDATERKKFIMKQLQERKEAMEEVAIFALLAEKDPTAAKLLEELEDLNKN